MRAQAAGDSVVPPRMVKGSVGTFKMAASVTSPTNWNTDANRKETFSIREGEEVKLQDRPENKVSN